IHVAPALLLMHAARPPRRPSRLGLGRRLASWHPSTSHGRRSNSSCSSTAKSKNSRRRPPSSSHFCSALVARISCPRFHNATIAGVICTRPRSIGVLLVGMLWRHPTNANRRSAIGSNETAAGQLVLDTSIHLDAGSGVDKDVARRRCRRDETHRARTSRISREAYVRFCEGLGVKFLGPTRHPRPGRSKPHDHAFRLRPESEPSAPVFENRG